MVIDLWRTTKRENSTATPVSQPGWFTNHVQKEVYLKEETDVLNPTFILKIPGHDGQNYVWAFGRYYWVKQIRILANNLFALDCTIDPLGSYRGHIQNTQAYVLYDSTPNTELPDNRLGVKTTATYKNNQVAMPWGFLSGAGTKFLAIEGDGELIDDGKADGATGVYIVNDASIQNIGMKIEWADFEQQIALSMTEPLPITWQTAYGNFNTMAGLQTAMTDAWTAGEYVEAVWLAIIYAAMWPIFGCLKSIIAIIKGLITSSDALSHVKAAWWLPFNFNDKGTQKNRVAIGSYVDVLGVSKLLTDPIEADEVSINIPWQFSDWRNSQNTEVQLFIPLIGTINIPSTAVKGHSTLQLYFGINLYSGHMAVRVRCADATIGTYGANVSSQLFIGDSNPNTPAITNTVVAGAALAVGAATGTAPVAIAGVASAAQSGVGAIQPISTSVGGIGGGIGNSLGSNIWCTTICHNTSDEPSDLINIIGTPTDVLKQLNGTGYCQTMQAHMNMQAVVNESYPTAAEVDMVDRALDSGVFLE